MSKNHSPELAGTIELSLENSTHAKPARTPRKWERVLRAFLTGQSYNRFESTRELRDWCLHSTVAGLQARGVTILRHDEVVPGYAGCPTHVCRYQLDRTPENISRATALLNANTAPRSRDHAADVGEHHQAHDDVAMARTDAVGGA